MTGREIFYSRMEELLKQDVTLQSLDGPYHYYIIQAPSTITMSGDYSTKILNDSVKFYLPRVEGYLEIVRDMALRYGGMSLIEFDGYFEGRFEPMKYTRVEIHTNDVNEKQMTELANKIRMTLKQKSLAFEFNNKLILVSEK